MLVMPFSFFVSAAAATSRDGLREEMLTGIYAIVIGGPDLGGDNTRSLC
jgi:hypothetical protein